MARAARPIHIPTLDPKFVRDRNPSGHWLVQRFEEHILNTNGLAGNLPLDASRGAQRTVEEFKAEAGSTESLSVALWLPTGSCGRTCWIRCRRSGCCRLGGSQSSFRQPSGRSDAMIRSVQLSWRERHWRLPQATHGSRVKVRPGIEAVIGKDKYDVRPRSAGRVAPKNPLGVAT